MIAPFEASYRKVRSASERAPETNALCEAWCIARETAPVAGGSAERERTRRDGLASRMLIVSFPRSTVRTESPLLVKRTACGWADCWECAEGPQPTSLRMPQMRPIDPSSAMGNKLYAPPPWADAIRNLPSGEIAKWRGNVAESDKGCTPSNAGLEDRPSIRYT